MWRLCSVLTCDGNIMTWDEFNLSNQPHSRWQCQNEYYLWNIINKSQQKVLCGNQSHTGDDQ